MGRKLRSGSAWAIRVRPRLRREPVIFALFDLAIDSKLRACDLTKLRLRT
jgi:hypothetical protein